MKCIGDEDALGQVGVDGSRYQLVDGDAVRPDFLSQTTSEHPDRGLRGVIATLAFLRPL